MATRRDELLDVLVDHVTEHGIGSATVRSLAAAADVAHNTITHHFGSRSELIAAIFERVAQRVADLQGQPLESRQFRVDRLHETWQQLTTGPGESLWPVFFEILSEALREPDKHRVFLAHVSHDSTIPLADELIRVGRPRREALAAATLIVATMRGLIIEAMCGAETERIEDALGILSQFATADLVDP